MSQKRYYRLKRDFLSYACSKKDVSAITFSLFNKYRMLALDYAALFIDIDNRVAYMSYGKFHPVNHMEQ